MKINFSTKMKTIEGKPLMKTDNQGKPDGEMELKDACVNALLANYNDEQKLQAEKKVVRFVLAQKIVASDGALEVSPEEVVLMKELVGKIYSPLIVGQVYELLK